MYGKTSINSISLTTSMKLEYTDKLEVTALRGRANEKQKSPVTIFQEEGKVTGKI